MEKIPCKICNKDFNNEMKLNKHIHRKHGENKMFGYNFCDQCMYKADTYEKFKQHKFRDHEDQYNCDLLEYKAKSKESLKHHIIRKHDKANYHCNLCDYKVKSEESLRHHIISKHD